ncbi:chromate efflux transporter [Mucilaginibacter gotjawali]|uniref:Chromate transporter n=2 Tax=Mucilaginibacter gotjawali TaxID=1550579 RepID=A0A839SP94_9SPHI|nr:chromate efflux transporter [Mucilaginibacter gotjawali]MBB3058309.1 chromate transporter [Mucilaginibacter gotjawali]BAU55572.1 putative chromate transport protein [Mucilaginibacter gotjawali]
MQDNRLKEIARVFLKLGVIGFGGPAVHIAMMEEEVVRKRQWFTHEHFIDLIGATNLIPGPNSTEMALHCGKERGGWKGLLVAGACFILPAVIITAAFAWAYQQYGRLPQVQPFIYGIKPAIIGVILSLMITLGKKTFKNIELGFIGLSCAILAIAGINEVLILFGAGFTGILIYNVRNKFSALNSISPFAMLPALVVSGDGSDWKIFWIFLKVGAILYGSGYVLFAFLDSELVKTGMLSRQTLIDAIAVGQFTPGPVFSSATFIGWQMGGLAGAAKATIGIFLPSFLFVGLLNPLVSWLRKSKAMSAFLDAVNASAIALILAVCVEMGKESVNNWKTVLILVAGIAVSLFNKKLNSAFIIIGGAAAGYLLWLI